MSQILLVEDSLAIVGTLVPNLRANQFSTVHCSNIRDAKKQLKENSFTLVILDINLPDGNGLDLCQEIHEAFPSLPIIVLTARLEEDTAVEGFARGAVDFVRKPFGLNEFIERVRRCIQRDKQKGRLLTFGTIAIDAESRQALVSGKTLELSPREFDLLLLLVRRAGDVVNRDDILNLFEDEGEMMDRTVDRNVSRLRRKIRTAGGSKIRVRSVYGFGYRLEEI